MSNLEECDSCHNLYNRAALHFVGDDNVRSLECPDCEKADFDAKVQESSDWEEHLQRRQEAKP